MLNATPSKVTGNVANQIFERSEASTVLRNFHPFGCPAYVLNDGLAAGKGIPKWHKWASGLVLPQFHLKFDNLLETVRDQEMCPNN